MIYKARLTHFLQDKLHFRNLLVLLMYQKYQLFSYIFCMRNQLFLDLPLLPLMLYFLQQLCL
uniref:Uncharacterized protein n=1 Tax=Siphoviridae sp. ctrpg19 TaxID=2826481 RepID=A0A8S5ML11_9CAUD|nr:MAG TPA: hypothetical protein [Siphoviridae sp. ctrpg19]